VLRVIADLPEGSQWSVHVVPDVSYTYHCSPSQAPRLARLVFKGVEKPRYILPVHP
jgi:hypothetical protein